MSAFQVAMSPEMRAALAPISHLSISRNYLKAEDGSPLPLYGIPAERGLLIMPSAPTKKVRIKLSLHISSTVGIVELRSTWDHRNIMPFLGYYLSQWGSKVGVAVVTPDFLNGSYVVYRNRHPKGLDVALRLRFVKDILSGVEYLHSRTPPVCYLQLSTYRIYIDENLNALIGEMNTAQEVNENGEVIHHVRRGLKSRGQMVRKVYTPATDVWDWASVAYEILTDEKIVGDETAGFTNGSMSTWTLPGKADKLLDINAPKPEHGATLRALHSLLPLCWSPQRRERPSISQIRQQAFLLFDVDAGHSVTTTLEEWGHLQILPDRLRILANSMIGRGGFGEVVVGILDGDSLPSREVAVKRLIMTGSAPPDPVRLMKRLARELRIWASIKHQNVLELIGWCLDENGAFPKLISPRMLNGSLPAYLKKYNPNMKQRISFVKGITEGLVALHTFNPPICHADLKPANVLLDADLNAVLCDFGLTTFIASAMGATTAGLITSTKIKGTVRYMGPELIIEKDSVELIIEKEDVSHTLESDIWAWGCTVFEVLRGFCPYATYGDLRMLVAIVEEVPPGDASLLLPRSSETIEPSSLKVLQLLHSVLPRCWSFEPQKRPPISRIALGIRNGDSILQENETTL